MKLTGELKDKVDQTTNLEEAKDVIAKAGMLLTDDEVSEVAGGSQAGNLIFEGKGGKPVPSTINGGRKRDKLDVL
jgi:hypothetical protein